MALQRTRRPRFRSGRSLCSLGSPLNARPFGGLPHDAGIEHDDVCVMRVGSRVQSDLFQFGADALNVGFVHLATEDVQVVLHENNRSPGNWERLYRLDVWASRCRRPVITYKSV